MTEEFQLSPTSLRKCSHISMLPYKQFALEARQLAIAPWPEATPLSRESRAKWPTPAPIGQPSWPDGPQSPSSRAFALGSNKAIRESLVDSFLEGLDAGSQSRPVSSAEKTTRKASKFFGGSRPGSSAAAGGRASVRCRGGGTSPSSAFGGTAPPGFFGSHAAEASPGGATGPSAAAPGSLLGAGGLAADATPSGGASPLGRAPATSLGSLLSRSAPAGFFGARAGDASPGGAPPSRRSSSSLFGTSPGSWASGASLGQASPARGGGGGGGRDGSCSPEGARVSSAPGAARSQIAGRPGAHQRGSADASSPQGIDLVSCAWQRRKKPCASASGCLQPLAGPNPAWSALGGGSPTAARRGAQGSLGGSPPAVRRAGTQGSLAGSPTAARRSALAAADLDLWAAKKAQDKLRVKDIPSNQKRNNAIAALEQDRQLARREIEEIERVGVKIKKEQDAAIYDRQLTRLYRPIDAPKEHLAPPCDDEDLLSTPKKEPWATLQGTQTIFNSVERANLLEACERFTALIRPWAPFGREEPGPPIITRPAMCCLLIALKVCGQWEELQYHSTLDGFDGTSGIHTVRGCSMSSGAVRGLPFEEQRGDVTVGVTALFEGMLRRMGGDRFDYTEYKKLLFDEYLPAARSFADGRLRQLAKWLTAGKAVAEKRGDVLSSQRELRDLEAVLQVEKEEAAALGPNKIPQTKSPQQSPLGSKAREEKAIEDAGAGSSAGGSNVEAPQCADGEALPLAIRPKVHKRSLLLELEQIKVVDGAASKQPHAPSGSKSAPPRGGEEGASKASKGAPAPKEGQSDELQEAQQAEVAAQLNEEDKLYAHTFAVSKCEFLSMTLLEPEVMHDVWMYYGIFRKLFEFYADVRTDMLRRSGPEKAEGHMTRGAFVLFCVDFGLFPRIVDFNTLQSIYQCAQSTLDLTPEEVQSFLAKEKDCPFKVGQCVQVCASARVQFQGKELAISDVSPGELFGQVIDADMDSESRACNVLLHGSKKAWVRLEDLRTTSKEPAWAAERRRRPLQERQREHLAWLSQDFSEMTEEQLNSVNILSSLEEWMTTNRMRSKDLFRRPDSGQNGCINVSEMLQGINRMFFEVPPAREQVARMMELIDSDGCGTVEYVELDAVLEIVGERKAQLRQSMNFFLKPKHEMTPAELAAEHFFVPVTRAMDTLGWHPSTFFRKFDLSSSGRLRVEELFKAARAMGIKHYDEDNFRKGLVLLEPNFDGTLGLRELKRILAMARQALRKQAKDPGELGTSPFLASAFVTTGKGEPLISLFGLKAFIECLLKLSIGYLSFHGTVEQSHLPTHSKVVWLLSYLSWRFERHKVEESAAAAAEQQEEAPGMFHTLSGRELTPVGEQPTIGGMERVDSNPAFEKSRKVSAERWSKVQRRNFRSLSVALNKMQGQGLASAVRSTLRRTSQLELDGPLQPADDEPSALTMQLRSTSQLQLDPPELAEGAEGGEESDSDESVESEATLEDEGAALSRTTSTALDKVRKVIKDGRFAWALPPIKRVILQAPSLFKSEPAGPPRLRGRSFARRGACGTCGAVPYKGWGRASCQACGLGEVVLLECLSSESAHDLPALYRLLPDAG